MTTAKITSKGQCTIPKSVREELGLKAGDEVDFYFDETGRLCIRKVLKANPFEKWVGFLTDLEGRDSDEIVREMRGP